MLEKKHILLALKCLEVSINKGINFYQRRTGPFHVCRSKHFDCYIRRIWNIAYWVFAIGLPRKFWTLSSEVLKAPVILRRFWFCHARFCRCIVQHHLDMNCVSEIHDFCDAARVLRYFELKPHAQVEWIGAHRLMPCCLAVCSGRLDHNRGAAALMNLCVVDRPKSGKSVTWSIIDPSPSYYVLLLSSSMIVYLRFGSHSPFCSLSLSPSLALTRAILRHCNTTVLSSGVACGGAFITCSGGLCRPSLSKCWNGRAPACQNRLSPFCNCSDSATCLFSCIMHACSKVSPNDAAKHCLCSFHFTMDKLCAKSFNPSRLQECIRHSPVHMNQRISPSAKTSAAMTCSWVGNENVRNY